MCGRLIQVSPVHTYAEMLEAELYFPSEIPARFNLAPTQALLLARQGEHGKRELTMARWGLVPSWSKGPDHRYSMINARAETVHEKPAYRGPFRHKRCLIPTEGFYEWKQASGGKQPYFFHMNDNRPFALAGLWDEWGELMSCSIVVTEANELMLPLHDRMPVILPREKWQSWLDPGNQELSALRDMLVSYAGNDLQYHAVDRRVNNPKNDDSGLIEPVEDPSDD